MGEVDNSWAALLEILRRTGSIPRKQLVDGLRNNNDANVPPEIQTYVSCYPASITGRRSR